MNRVHFIGIGGTGLSAIARILVERGYVVSGSDRVLSPLARELVNLGVTVFEGHSPANVNGADLVIRSSAVKDDNPEVQAALAAGIPVLKRAEFLSTLINGQDCIAVAGTHGKTTTTAMVAWTLNRLGLDPSYLIGGVSKNLGRNAHSGKGRYFVIEADEYDNMFLGLNPQVAIVTIVEHDHPDFFPTPGDYLSAFQSFVAKIKPGGTLLACQDAPAAASLVARRPLEASFTYGSSPAAAYQATEIETNLAGGSDFSLVLNKSGSGHQLLVKASLLQPGLHMVRNATAVLALAHLLGLPLKPAAEALHEYRGSGRRFDLLGEAGGVVFYNDYAHHPTEIQVTLAAARQFYPGRRIWAVWQPHTFSRTLTLLDGFLTAFADADQVLVTEIYAAREQSTGFSAAQVVAQMSHPAVRFCPTLDDAAMILSAEFKPGDVVLVLSAGDADQITEKVYYEFKNQEGYHA